MDQEHPARIASWSSRRWRAIVRRAIREPVVISAHGRSSIVVMSLDRCEQLTREAAAAALTPPETRAIPSGLPPGKFNVLCRIDAYADYVAEVEAESAKEAAQLAYESHEAYEWQFSQTAEFDARWYVALDDLGDEIDGTEIGDL